MGKLCLTVWLRSVANIITLHNCTILYLAMIFSRCYSAFFKLNYMKKTYLLKYESPKFLALKDWVDYKLHLEIVWFWGLFKTHKISDYRIYDNQNSKAHFDHWDKLIADRQQLR